MERKSSKSETSSRAEDAVDKDVIKQPAESKKSPIGLEFENPAKKDDLVDLDDDTNLDDLIGCAQMWNPKEFDEKMVVKELENGNKTLFDKKVAVVVFVIGLPCAWALFTISFLWYYIFSFDNISEMQGMQAYSSEFWFVVLQRIGLLTFGLFVIIPMYKFIRYIFEIMNEGAERKSMISIQSLRFAFILKYKGEIERSNIMTYSFNKKKIANSEGDILKPFLNTINTAIGKISDLAIKLAKR